MMRVQRGPAAGCRSHIMIMPDIPHTSQVTPTVPLPPCCGSSRLRFGSKKSQMQHTGNDHCFVRRELLSKRVFVRVCFFVLFFCDGSRGTPLVNCCSRPPQRAIRRRLPPRCAARLRSATDWMEQGMLARALGSSLVCELGHRAWCASFDADDMPGLKRLSLKKICCATLDL
jgi:hypothetical protein